MVSYKHHIISYHIDIIDQKTINFKQLSLWAVVRTQLAKWMLPTPRTWVLILPSANFLKAFILIRPKINEKEEGVWIATKGIHVTMLPPRYNPLVTPQAGTFPINEIRTLNLC